MCVDCVTVPCSQLFSHVVWRSWGMRLHLQGLGGTVPSRACYNGLLWHQDLLHPGQTRSLLQRRDARIMPSTLLFWKFKTWCVWNTLVSDRSLAGCTHLTRFASFCFERNFFMYSYESLHVHPTCLCFADLLVFFDAWILLHQLLNNFLIWKSTPFCMHGEERPTLLVSCSLGLGRYGCPQFKSLVSRWFVRPSNSLDEKIDYVPFSFTLKK